MNNRLLKCIILVFFLSYIFLIIEARGSSGGGGSRGGGSRSGSSSSGGSRSSSRVSIGSRYTSRTGSTGSLFRFTRSASSRNGFYNYGSYSGTRFGTSIRRTLFWPVRRVVYGTTYYSNHNNRVPSYTNSDVPSNIVISDTFTKIKTNETGFSYTCEATGRTTITCFEPPESQIDLDTDNDPDLEVFDGGCCENTSTNQAVCCVIGINDDVSKAKILKQIYISSIFLVITSLLLLRRCCR